MKKQKTVLKNLYYVRYVGKVFFVFEFCFKKRFASELKRKNMIAHLVERNGK